jgi:hypothetical protein
MHPRIRHHFRHIILTHRHTTFVIRGSKARHDLLVSTIRTYLVCCFGPDIPLLSLYMRAMGPWTQPVLYARFRFRQIAHFTASAFDDDMNKISCIRALSFAALADKVGCWLSTAGSLWRFSLLVLTLSISLYDTAHCSLLYDRLTREGPGRLVDFFLLLYP